MPEWWETGFFEEEIGNFLFTDDKWASAKEEVSFLSNILELDPGAKILDLCCGVGRHSIYLAKKGFDVVGLDLSEAYIEKARKTAQKQEVKVKFLIEDMRNIPFENEFDGVINVFTSFGYFYKHEENQEVLNNIYKSLKPGGRFFIEMINRDHLVKHFQNTSWSEINGKYILEERSFDQLRDMMYNRWVIINGKNVKEMPFSHHVYSAAKLNKMLHEAGFVVEEFFGNLKGAPFVLDSPRLCALSYKKLKKE